MREHYVEYNGFHFTIYVEHYVANMRKIKCHNTCTYWSWGVLLVRLESPQNKLSKSSNVVENGVWSKKLWRFTWSRLCCPKDPRGLQTFMKRLCTDGWRLFILQVMATSFCRVGIYIHPMSLSYVADSTISKLISEHLRANNTFEHFSGFINYSLCIDYP